MAKARDVLSMRVQEAAGAIVQHWEGGNINPDNILDHVDGLLIGNAIKSPIVKRWLVKLVLQALVPPYKEIEPQEFPPTEEYVRNDSRFTFIYLGEVVHVSNGIKTKHLIYPEAQTFRDLIVSKGFLLLT